MLGGAIGDALGYQIEFDRGIREKQVTQFKDDFGIISDDTQMTLFTATALLWQKTRFFEKGMSLPQTDAVYHGYLDWLDTQIVPNKHNSISWIKKIPALNKHRAPGNTCLSSLNSGKMGTMDWKINNSKGCGSVMRIAPCGVFESDPDAAGMLAAKCAAITHGHKLAQIPSYVCAAMINMLIHQDIGIEQALMDSLKLLETHEQLFYENPKGFFGQTPMAEFMNLLNRAIWLSKEPLSDTDCIRQIGEGWVADEAFAIAIYSCLKYPNSFEDAIVCAVNHDGDSDSTGAIAGNIIGAALGVQNIPQYYVDNVELKDVILEIADDLHLVKTDNSVMYTDPWIKKYIECNQTN
jgi:ADP-ribosylglycohydrolase